KLGFEPRLLELIGEPPNYAAALMPMDQWPGEPIMIPASPLALRDRANITHLLLKRGTPSICAFREVMEAGALMSYGVNLVDVFRDIAAFVDQVARGSKAGDVPMRAVALPHRVQSQVRHGARPCTLSHVARPRRRGDRVKRREFITLLGGAAAWPLAARAQQRAKPARIGYLSASSPPDANLESFIRGMGAVGYREGRDFVIEARYVSRDYSKFPALSDELLRAQDELIVAGGPAFRTWRLAAVPVPVVFLFSGDPVDAGIVASFARPGGNVTGVSLLSLDLSVKRVQLLKEAKPTMIRVAVLSTPTHPGEMSELKATREAALKLG